MLNDAQIDQLRGKAKLISNPRTRRLERAKHYEYNYEAESRDGDKFKVFTRQSKTIFDNFSCGLQHQLSDGTWITLARYNGSSHPHTNDIEKTSFSWQCHIHLATERYQAMGKKAEKYAEATERYSTLKGALSCLLMDWNISGLKAQGNTTTGELFDD